MSKIKITKDGPYIVSGNIPLSEEAIMSEGLDKKYKFIKAYEVGETYRLCRCGKSKNMPFCDGSHIDCKFHGKTTAPLKTIKEQSVVYENDDLILEDAEELCAFARFCHGKGTDVWNSIDENENDLAIKLACDCPAGRLVVIDKKTNEVIEPKYEKSILIIQDPEKECSGPLWVRGGIEIEDENGNILETRNRVTLCRCGGSSNKPYCDAYHVNSKFKG